jgi:hypothetical protein
MPIQQMLLGVGPSGVNAIDWLGVPENGNSSAFMQGNYDSEGNFHVFFSDSTWTNVKIKADGTVDWSTKFASHSAGAFKACDVGYNDILVCLGYTANNGLFLWGVSKTGTLLWNKNYEINNSSLPNNGNTLTFPQNNGPCVRAMTNDDIAIICVGYNETGSNAATNAIFLTVKVTDGSFIGWGALTSGSDGRGFKPDSGFAAFLPSSSTTGYWSIVSEDSTGSGNNQAQYRSWRQRGYFYTAGHSGSKDITKYSSSQGLRVNNDGWDGRIFITCADCLKNGSGSSTSWDSLITYAGYRHYSGSYAHRGAVLHSTWANNPLKIDVGGLTYIRSLARKGTGTSNSETYFMLCDTSASGVPNQTILIRINNNTVTWARRFRAKDSSNTYKNTIPKKVYIDPNGDKGMILMQCSGLNPALCMGQFDTGTTAPTTGTYTFSGVTGDNYSIEIDNPSVTVSWLDIQSASGSPGIINGNNADKWEDTTWATQTLSTTSEAIVKETWD